MSNKVGFCTFFYYWFACFSIQSHVVERQSALVPIFVVDDDSQRHRQQQRVSVRWCNHNARKNSQFARLGKIQQRQHQGRMERKNEREKKKREHFLLCLSLAERLLFCSRNERISMYFSSFSRSCARRHFLLCSASGPFILLYRAMPAVYVCVCAHSSLIE